MQHPLLEPQDKSLITGKEAARFYEYLEGLALVDEQHHRNHDQLAKGFIELEFPCIWAIGTKLCAQDQ
jgi:hypothetical protein